MPAHPGRQAERPGPVGRRAERSQRSATRRTRRLRAVAASTVAVVIACGAMAVILSRRDSDRDLTTSLAQQPQVSVTASASDPALTLLGEATPGATVSVAGSPSPGASASAAAKTGAGAKTSARSTSAKSPATTTTRTSTGTRPGVVLDGRRMGGWYAGAGGSGVADGSFASWLGQPLGIVSTWADTGDEEQRTVSGLTATYANWKGAIDIAVGGMVIGSGESYAAAANGAYDARWRQAAGVIASVRKGASGPTFVRPFHEYNGTWMGEWSINSGNVADFKRAFTRYAQILRAAMPEVYIVWCPNSGDHSGVPVETQYPGDDVVDVVAPDYYHDGSSEDPTSTTWRGGSPLGMDAWRRFAASHGKPIGMPEWGLKSEGGGDSPEWIRAVNAWATQNANTATWQIGERIPAAAAGKVLYISYFNVVHGGQTAFTIHGYGANPASEAAYKSLRWGNNT